MSDDDELVLSERRTVLAPARPGRHAAEDPDLPGEGAVIDGKYRVERVLGAGGMGVVVAAVHLGLNQRVALKFVKVGPGAEELAERIRREARIAFRIKSQHAARLLDVGALASGAPYLVMEHLEGRDLARELDARGPLPIDEAVDHVIQACEAMAEAHGLGIVHRDLKPGNLFLTRGADGRALVKVLDFGIAKAALGLEGVADSITGACAVLGSPAYMSPEQVRGAHGVDARSDVWSLGIIMHELLTGATPFAPGPVSAVCAAIAADAPERVRARRPDVPEELEEVVLRALEKDPARRCASVCAFAAELAPFASSASGAVLERIAHLAGARPPAPSAPAPAGADAAITLSAWNAQSRRPLGPFRYAAALLAIAGLAGAWAVFRPTTHASSGAGVPAASVPAEAAALPSAPDAPPSVAPTATSTPPPAPPSVPAPSVASTAANPAPPAPRAPRAPVSAPAAAPTAAPSASAVPVPAAPPARDDLEERATSRRH